MKKLRFVFLILGGLSASFSSCTEESRVEALKHIDGRWQVETVNYSINAGQDSLVNSVDYFLNFEDCSNKENKTGCDLNVERGGKTKLFSYKVGADGRAFVVISVQGSDTSSDYLETAKHLAGTYFIQRQTDTELVLLDADASVNEVGVTSYKTRELRARKAN